MNNEVNNFRHRRVEEDFQDMTERSPLSRFILRNFRGANVTLTLVNGQTITGEVVDGFDNVIGIKMGSVISFVNERFIVTFI